MRIIFVRHGESEANLLNEFSNRGLKHGLTEKGKAQAVALVQALGSVSVSRIFCSPLLRAIQTAEILADKLNVPCQIVDALREYDCGILEGMSDPASWAEYKRVLDDWMINHRWESRVEGGESFLEIKARFVPFIEHLVKACSDSSEGIVLVGHGGLYRCVLPMVLENVDFGFAMKHPLSNTGYVEAETVGGRLVSISWNGRRADPE